MASEDRFTARTLRGVVPVHSAPVRLPSGEMVVLSVDVFAAGMILSWLFEVDPRAGPAEGRSDVTATRAWARLKPAPGEVHALDDRGRQLRPTGSGCTSFGQRIFRCWQGFRFATDEVPGTLTVIVAEKHTLSVPLATRLH